MIQRKCGTCKFFEEGGIAASGWCRHPDRQALEHMVLVRRTELACRDGWDHDLWEPRESGQSASKRRKTAESRRTVVTTADGADAESDRVVSLGERSGERESRTARETPAASYGGANPRPSEPDSSWDIDPLSGVSEAEPLRQIDDSLAQVDELREETVSIRTSQSDRVSHPVNSGQAGWTDYPAEQQREPVAEPGSNVLNGTHPAEAIPSPPVRQSGITEPFSFEESTDLSVDVPSEAGGYSPANGFAEEVEQDQLDFQGVDDVRLPVVGNLKPCCRNCRDFIPREGGRQGWCSNPFAFDERQLVEGDSLACQNTLGSWWSPSDDWWMERADIAHHSAPTPLVDNLIRELRHRLLETDGSTEERGRS